MDKNNNATARLLILDTSGVYTQIFDEIYVPVAEADKMRKMYAEYLVVEVPKNK
ncbi:hypothetical protein SDC9_201641 [bioreactor metagenome]|uniref:Uncharacterized protein n=1 Tax=bioreactor metagenome TaxID=1076179 RepID=A0A645IT26_9ZZZZ|nr:hypothetical protein [Candidatus Metalachnospira sp.]